MPVGARVVLHIERDGFVNRRANAVTDVTAHTQKVQAGFVVHQYRQPHLGLGDVGQFVV